MAELSTTHILTGAALVLSAPVLIKLVHSYLKKHDDKTKYPNEIDLNRKINNSETFNDYFNKNYEQCLIDWCKQYPNGCTLSLKNDDSSGLFSGFFGQQSYTKILILNSIDSIKKFSKNDLIADRPQLFLLDVISHHYQGSFFRMYNSDLHEIRKTSLHGLHRLVLSNPDAENLVFDELERFFQFLDRDILNNKQNGLIENAQIYLQQVLVNIVFRVGLGIRFDYDLEKDSTIKTQMAYMSKLLSALNVVELSKITSQNANSAKYSKLVEFLGGVVGSLYNFITQAVVGYKQNAPDEPIADIQTLADLLLNKQKEQLKEKLSLNSGDVYSDDDIIVQVFTVFLATCATTGFTLSWAFHYLSRSSQVCDNILKEITNVFGDANSISWNKRAHMVYTEATINEILRLSSTQALIPRAAYKEINIDGLTIPAHTPVLINTFGIHHDSTQWANPTEFQPERWLSEDKKILNTHNDCFIPFGVQPRTCVGDTLSKALLFSIITNLLQRFSFEHVPSSSEKFKNEGLLGVMRCPHEFNMKLKRRV